MDLAKGHSRNASARKCWRNGQILLLLLHLRVPWCQVKIQTQEGDERSSILCLTLEEIRTQVGEALSLTSKIRHGGHACSHLPSQRLKPQRNSTKLAQRK